MYTQFVLGLLCIACVYGAKVGGRRDMSKEEIMGAQDLLAGLDLQVDRFNRELSHQPFRVVRHSILEAQVQVVAGTMYLVKVKLVVSTCKNIKENQGKSIAECPAKQGAIPSTCIVSIWSRKWIKDESRRLIVKMKCLRS